MLKTVQVMQQMMETSLTHAWEISLSWQEQWFGTANNSFNNFSSTLQPMQGIIAVDLGVYLSCRLTSSATRRPIGGLS
jgi:hypothetical protein